MEGIVFPHPLHNIEFLLSIFWFCLCFLVFCQLLLLLFTIFERFISMMAATHHIELKTTTASGALTLSAKVKYHLLAFYTVFLNLICWCICILIHNVYLPLEPVVILTHLQLHFSSASANLPPPPLSFRFCPHILVFTSQNSIGILVFLLKELESIP